MRKGVIDGRVAVPSSMKKIRPNTQIASGFSVAAYRELRIQLDQDAPSADVWTKIIDVFTRRLDERYLRPIEHLDRCENSELSMIPGFAMLALDCIVIDTLQSFREKRRRTTKKSFQAFLKHAFEEFTSTDAVDFWMDIRNGLLHDGEARHDWTVAKNTPGVLWKDPVTGRRTINRTRFHATVRSQLKEFCSKLESGDSALRASFLQRMDQICGYP